MHNCPWDAESIGSAIPQSAKDNGISPRSAYRAAYAALMGLEELYAVGGAQSIGALAYGTESIQQVV